MDHLQDHDGRRLLALAAAHELPPYVKSASLQPRPRQAFADPLAQQYPLDDRADVWLSAAYYASAGQQRPAVETAILKAAAVWGIAADVHQVLAPKTPPAPAAVDYAYHDAHDRGYLPLRHGADVKAAADWLLRYRDQLAYPDRRQIATRLLQKAAALALTLPLGQTDFLQKQAGIGRCRPEITIAACEARVLAARYADPSLRAQAEKIAAAVRADPASVVETAGAELVAALEAIDRELKHAYVAGEYLRPEDAVYGATAAKAAAVAAELLQWPDGRVYARSEFARVPAGALDAAAVGPFALGAEKLAALYAGADRDRQAEINAALNRAGVVPIAAALSAAELAAMAG